MVNHRCQCSLQITTVRWELSHRDSGHTESTLPVYYKSGPNFMLHFVLNLDVTAAGGQVDGKYHFV